MSKLRARFSFMNRIEARQDRREFILAIFFVFVSMDVLPRATILRVFALYKACYNEKPRQRKNRSPLSARVRHNSLKLATPVTSYESPNSECMQDNLHTWRPGTVAQYGNTILCWFPVTSTGAPGSLSSDVFERRTLTGSGLFALLSRDFEHIFGQTVSIRVNTVINKNLVPQGIL